MNPTIHVFLVDDHPLVRELLANLLHQSGEITVLGSAARAAEGLALMQQRPPDVAIVDLALPGSSGLDLIKDLAVHLPQVQVVVLSMHEEIYTIERAVRAGARGYVTKRESTEHILEAVRAVAAGRLFASDQIMVQLAERRFAPRATEAVEELSDRELEVFSRLGHGQATRRIADDLQVSIKTIQAYCARIKEKLGFTDATELIRHAVRWVDRRDSAR